MPTCPNCRLENPDGARFCSRCGSSLGAPRPVEGERRFATVLFADVVRSTALASQLDPEDWAAVMNGAFAFVNAAITRYEGTVSRLMGDAVLALFGAPVAHEDDAERAVRAALEILEAAEGYAVTVQRRYGIEFGLRIGINTGTAVLAVLGDEVKAEYTAMGDTANLASRLQAAARPGTVLISGATYRLVRSRFDVEPVGPLEVKGKTDPIEAYEVRGIRAIPGKPRGIEGLASPLVGRDAELALLRDRLAALSSAGRGAVVAVVGEAGLGKSRLVAEARALREAVGLADAGWYEGRAISYGHTLPYHPWQELGRQLLGASDSEGGEALREKLHAFVGRFGVAPDHLPFLETMLAVETEASRAALGAYEEASLVHGVAEAVVSTLRAAMREGRPRPHVLVFDDLHWSDGPSLELIAEVAALAPADPLLLLCVMRPDHGAPSWRLLDRLQGRLPPDEYLRIDLKPLATAEARQLLGNLLHVEGLPEDVRSLILKRAEGNPFYLEEVLRSLIDAGCIVNEDGHWRATGRVSEVAIPDTLEGVLSARIDRLPDKTKRVAQAASVLGRVFLYRPLESVCRGLPERIEAVDTHLGVLAEEQLVREKAREPEREYIFKHALTCEAAYQLLLKSRRRELHARAGAVLEEMYPERLDELAALLAHHFGEGGDPARAARYSLRAAERARKLYALQEAVEHYERAYESLDSLPEPPFVDLHAAILGWAITRHRLNRYDGVIERLERAVALARAAGDKARLAEALTWIATVHMMTGFPTRSIPYLTESGELASELGDESLLLLPLYVASESLVYRDPARAVEQFQKVIELARRNENMVLGLEGHALGVLAMAHARLGHFDAAEATIAQALAVAPKSASPVQQADVHIAVGSAYKDLGRLDKAVEHARIGAEMAHEAKGFECACAGFYGVGMGRFEQHEVEGALVEFRKSLRIADRASAHAPGRLPVWESFVNRILGSVAAAELERGGTESVEKLEAALANARSDNDEYYVALFSEQLASALHKLGRTAEAEAHLRAALDFYRGSGVRPYLARALELSAELHERLGRPDDARRDRTEAAALRSTFRAPPGSSVASAS